MHKSIADLDLTFPTIPRGSRRPLFNLKRLLFKGGASLRSDAAELALQEEKLGRHIASRVELVQRIHEAISTKLALGGSKETAKTEIKLSVVLFKWAEQNDEVHLTIDGIQNAYLHWADHLYYRNTVSKDLSGYSAYTAGRCVATVLDKVLERPTPLIELTRLREPKGGKRGLSASSEKQLLTSTFAFGRLLQDICDGLPLKVIWGPRPVVITLQDGQELVYWMAARLRTSEQFAAQIPEKAAMREKRNQEYLNSRTIESRSRLINLRILAELQIFIAQAGMNLEQAKKIQLRHFSYSSDIDGYRVRDYKNRRHGEVLFEIFKDYRGHFERYLEWRRSLFPKEKRLFPIIRRGSHEGDRPAFNSLQKACKQTGVQWFPPSTLRGTRVNWFLRRSGDEDLTADVAQHLAQTTLRHYEVPSHHRAVGELTRFWQTADPYLSGASQVASIAPGVCDGAPVQSQSKPASAASPDCVRPSGCLWCEHHRDIDSANYVWALASFKHLKILELSKDSSASGGRGSDHPAEHAVGRLGQKLTWFRESNLTRRGWVEEALTRIDEGLYHGDWAHLIVAVEAPTQ